MTAVEWLESEFNKWAEGGLFIPPHIITQAKEMEKQQIKDAYKHELNDSLGTKILSEQYYNETFKSE